MFKSYYLFLLLQGMSYLKKKEIWMSTVVGPGIMNGKRLYKEAATLVVPFL